MRALSVEISPADLRAFVRSQIDKRFHETGDNVGLHPDVQTVDITSWGHGFWNSVSRTITFALHGFHDNGLASDTNFQITLGLRFALVAPSQFGQPVVETLIAILEFLRVIHEGHGDDWEPVAPGEIISRVGDGIHKAFYPDSPDASHPEVPPGAIFVASVPIFGAAIAGQIDVIDILATSSGALQVLLNPLPGTPGNNMGEARQQAAQTAVDILLAS
jgi:hypothetical protein